MSLFDNPPKAKNIFGIFLALSIVFFLATGVFSYLYYQKYMQNKTLESQIWELEGKSTTTTFSAKQSEADLKKQITDLQTENIKLTKTNKELNDQATANKTKVDKVLTYNQFFEYLNSVIEKYNGFDGWTDADYQAGLTKAQATGDTSFVATVNWAWYETTVPQMTRAIGVWKAISTGITNSLK